MITVETVKNIIDVDHLKKLFKTYCSATGLSVWLYSANGEEWLSVRANGCICDFVKDKSICKSKLIYSGEKSAELGKPYIFETACNLIACVTPLIIEGVYTGFIVTGPVSLWDSEDFIEEDFIQSCKGVGVDVENPNFNISAIKSVDCEAMTGLADMLKIMLDYMVEKEIAFRNKIEIESKEFNNFSQNLKTENDSVKEQEKYPEDLERRLITCVRLGERQEAKALINEFFTETLFFVGGDLNVFKAKLYELMAFFSRTAVEAGAKIKDLSRIVTKSSGLLKENVDFQETCVMAVEILDDYLDIVCNTRQKPQKSHTSIIIKYIDENCGNPELNLKTVSAKVFLSRFYVSHLFNEELGMTFVEYLTKVRVEKAKTMLSEGKTVKETAELVGFNDVSYFNKVFKRRVGVSASKYRKN